MSHFYEAQTPEDVPPSHLGDGEGEWHTHRCKCGTEWTCAARDCYWADSCETCEDEDLTIWLDAQQPVLEPIDALIGED